MRERVLAVIGAVALIAVALLVRSWLADDGEGSASGSGGGGSSGRPVVACTPDLMPVCHALADDGRIVEDPPTFDLTDAELPPEVDGWITWDPAPWIMNENAGQNASAWSDPEVLGSAPLGVLLSPAEREELGADCGWACITERVGPDWPIGVGNPSTSEGLVRWRPIAQALAEDSDDRDQNVPLRRISEILESPADGQNGLTLRNFSTAPGRATAYLGLAPALENASHSRELVVITPEPETIAALVVVARYDTESVTLADHLDSDALQEALKQVGVTPGGTLVDEDEALGLFHIWSETQ